MKKILILFMFIGAFAFSQEKQKEICKKGSLYEATYYHDNGVVAQHGFFNKSGGLQGIWTSYDIVGKRIALGNYENGQKTGKWLFWFNDKLTEVDYEDFKIATVSEWKERLVVR